jgi:hypothetical protein
MPGYHIYTVGSDGRFIAVEELECADDPHHKRRWLAA